MEWIDDGIVLSARPHGETSAVLTLLTAEHGRHGGLVRGGAGKRLRGLLQPGNALRATWRGRLAEHLGTYAVEMIEAHGAAVLTRPAELAALSSACALCEAVLPEREPHPRIFEGLAVLLTALEGEDWPSVYVKWEVGVLADLGFGLDLTACAATGGTEDLAWVSPRTGRAVSRQAGAPYEGKLLALPPFLLESGRPGSVAEVLDGLRLTGHFLDGSAAKPHGKSLPAARQRLVERMKRIEDESDRSNR